MLYIMQLTYKQNALVSFIENGVDANVLSSQIMPVIEKMLLRSPEVCLPSMWGASLPLQ